MTTIYLTHSVKRAIDDFVEHHKELYNKINEQFTDKARRECHWERFTNSWKLSVKLYMT